MLSRKNLSDLFVRERPWNRPVLVEAAVAVLVVDECLHGVTDDTAASYGRQHEQTTDV